MTLIHTHNGKQTQGCQWPRSFLANRYTHEKVFFSFTEIWYLPTCFTHMGINYFSFVKGAQVNLSGKHPLKILSEGARPLYLGQKRNIQFVLSFIYSRIIGHIKCPFKIEDQNTNLNNLVSELPIGRIKSLKITQICKPPRGNRPGVCI